MKSQRNIARQLLGLTLTLVGLMSWTTLSIPLPERAVQAATQAKVTEPTGQAVSRSAANGRVAFVSTEGNGLADIYTMNPDGSDRKQLTFSLEYEDEPIWSPDGTKIAFVRYSSNFAGIFVMNADGSDQRRLTESGNSLSPTWSPDGTKIAFWNGGGIFVMNADGSDQRAVASGFQEPAWSPDGLKLVVAASGGGIYLINVDGSNRTQITQPADLDWDADYQPAWSPDGSKITFTRGTSCFGGCDYQHLWVVNADGSNPTKLTDSYADTSAWSPDGTRIIFSKNQNCCMDLFVMNPDGSGLTNITNTNVKHEYSPSWQPLSLPPLVNPIDNAQFFVRQHYLDFLNREPDPAGLAFWTNEITSCGFDAQCVEVKRINVSAAFFLSIEFQNTGYLVERIYKAAYGDALDASTGLGVPMVRRTELTADSALIGQGVVVNSSGWEQQLETNKRAYALAFVQRQRFTDAYPQTLTPTEFVARLNQNTGGVLTQAEADALVVELIADGTAATRAEVLRRVSENATIERRERNRAFILMQYFGYLRRQPDAAPDINFAGYHFWLAKLDHFGGDFVQAEMVKAFIMSSEYRHRFGH